MDRTKCAQLLRQAREHGLHNWDDLLKRYLDKEVRCEDCRGPDLGPVVLDHIWQKIIYGWQNNGMFLCQKCMEWRLGRTIKEADCKLLPWNVLRGNLVAEGKIMANRALQAKRLKMKRERQNFPRYLSADKVKVDRYNNTSPYAMKNRAFESPDAVVLDKDIRGIMNGVVTDDKPKEFNSISLAHVHNKLDRAMPLEQVAFHTWSNWRRTGQTEFNCIKMPTPPHRRVDMWFSGSKWLFIQEDYRTETHSASIFYLTKESAEWHFYNDQITWAEHRPLNST